MTPHLYARKSGGEIILEFSRLAKIQNLLLALFLAFAFSMFAGQALRRPVTSDTDGYRLHHTITQGNP